MSHESAVRSWTLEEWKRLSQHLSPFVRLWVAKSARKHTDRESLSGQLRTLLEDERPRVRWHTEMVLPKIPSHWQQSSRVLSVGSGSAGIPSGDCGIRG